MVRSNGADSNSESLCNLSSGLFVGRKGRVGLTPGHRPDKGSSGWTPGYPPKRGPFTEG